MIGAVIGDIAGSRDGSRLAGRRKFPLLTSECSFADGTVLTLAVGAAVLDADEKGADLAERTAFWLLRLGKAYPVPYGENFRRWLADPERRPYNSFGNNAAVRISAAAESSLDDLDEALRRSDAVTAVTHNHWEGMKGARAVTHILWMAGNGASKEAIRDMVSRNYYYLDFGCKVYGSYAIDESCPGTVPLAVRIFLESESFEDAVRSAVSFGGNTRALAAVTGAIAGACYGVPGKLRKAALKYLDADLRSILDRFEAAYGRKEAADQEPDPKELASDG